MFHRLRKAARTAHFDLLARDVRKTPPVELDECAAVTFFSQICHRDVLMYLLAVKSLAARLRPAAIMALNDGSLTDSDRRLLEHHLPGMQILALADVDPGPCPPGGTWERLLAIHECCDNSYVIQVDADTLTLDEPTEVLRLVRENRSFTLGTSMGREFITLAEAGRRARQHSPDDTHVQDTAERVFADLDDADHRWYVRGNSGFAGFARGQHSRGTVEEFSREMSRHIGAAKWSQWGSEQVTSNYSVANAPEAEVLPYPRYGYFHPDQPHADRPFIHFIGTYRFQGGVYATLARHTIEQLR